LVICKKEYKKYRICPNSVNEFKKIWLKVSKLVAKKFAPKLTATIHKRLRQIGYYGVYEPYK
jgi:hypothetical protein